MEQLSLSDIITGAWEEIKGHVLKVLKEVVELMLVEGQSKVLGRGRYERGGSKGWRWGYRQRKSILTPLEQPGWAHHPPYQRGKARGVLAEEAGNCWNLLFFACHEVEARRAHGA